MIENLLYTALASLIVVVVLHIGVFWVSRVIQPPKPRVVYMPQPVAQQYNTLPVAAPPLPPAPLLSPPLSPPLAAPPIPEMKLPTYESPPSAAKPPTLPSLPPPIETRETSRS